MTEQQIADQVAQVELDGINLDFAKWSAERHRQRLPTDHSLWVQARDQTLAEMKARNEKTRAAYLANLEAEKENKRRLNAAALDAQLEPQKEKLKRAWLADHPGQTSHTFEISAWPHLKANLLEQHQTADFEATKQAMASNMGENSL